MKRVSAPRPVSVGNGLLVMTTEEFINGYQAGHLAYMSQSRTVLLTDETVIIHLLDKLEDIRVTDRYGVGYIVGWVAALAYKGTQMQESRPA